MATAVAGVDRATAFYAEVFGAAEVFRQPGFVQLQTPGSRDVLALEEDATRSGTRGGVLHFGFRLTDPADVDHAAQEVERAGGTILSRGEFCPGEPYVFAADPDGYELEIWYELPTPVDPTQL